MEWSQMTMTLTVDELPRPVHTCGICSAPIDYSAQTERELCVRNPGIMHVFHQRCYRDHTSADDILDIACYTANRATDTGRRSTAVNENTYRKKNEYDFLVDDRNRATDIGRPTTVNENTYRKRNEYTFLVDDRDLDRDIEWNMPNKRRRHGQEQWKLPLLPMPSPDAWTMPPPPNIPTISTAPEAPETSWALEIKEDKEHEQTTRDTRVSEIAHVLSAASAACAAEKPTSPTRMRKTVSHFYSEYEFDKVAPKDRAPFPRDQGHWYSYHSTMAGIPKYSPGTDPCLLRHDLMKAWQQMFPMEITVSICRERIPVIMIGAIWRNQEFSPIIMTRPPKPFTPTVHLLSHFIIDACHLMYKHNQTSKFSRNSGPRSVIMYTSASDMIVPHGTIMESLPPAAIKFSNHPLHRAQVIELLAHRGPRGDFFQRFRRSTPVAALPSTMSPGVAECGNGFGAFHVGNDGSCQLRRKLMCPCMPFSSTLRTHADRMPGQSVASLAAAIVPSSLLLVPKRKALVTHFAAFARFVDENPSLRFFATGDVNT